MQHRLPSNAHKLPTNSSANHSITNKTWAGTNWFISQGIAQTKTPFLNPTIIVCKLWCA